MITCPTISNLTATNITDQSADIEWSPRGTETSWDIYVTTTQTDVPDSTTAPTTTVNDTTHSLSGLNGQTTYYVYVRANCGSGDVSRWRSVSFTTSQVPAPLPFSCDFEDATQNSEWGITNGTQTNKWFIGSAVNNTDNGSNALYISNDNGTTNAYSHTTSYVYAYRDIEFTQGAAAYQIDFDWRNQGESAYYDYLRVFIGDPYPVVAGSSMPSAAHATQIGNYYGQPTWQHATIALSSEFSGVKRLYFHWYNDDGGGSNPPAAVDNIQIVALNCGFPTSIALDTTTSHNAIFHWHPATPNDNAWDVAVAPYGTPADSATFDLANDTVYNAQGLLGNTRYVAYVRTNCGSDVSTAISISFRTACDDYATLPINEDFDTYGSSVIPSCWTKISTYNSYPYIYSSAAHTGTYGMYFYNTTFSGGTYSYLAAPAIDPTEDLTGLTVRFDMRRTNSNVMATLGLMSDPTDTSTFTALYPVSLTTSWDEYEFPLSNVTATGRHIAIKTELDPNATGTNGYIYMDNFNVEYTPSCLRPSNLVSTGNTQSSVSLSWHEAGSATSWNVAYGPAGFNPDASGADVEYVSDTTITIYNLTGGQTYDFYVQANCGVGVSEWRGPISVAPGQYNMHVSGWDTLYTCGSVIYDDGGPNGDYSSNCSSYLVIYPDHPGNFVEISGTLTAESSIYDYLIIYDGVGTDNQILKTNQTSSSTVYNIPSIVSSTGPLTLYFKSDGSVQYSGFELTTSCVSCVSPTLEVSSLGVDEATLSWSSYTGTQTSFEVVYGLTGFDPDSVLAETVSNATSLQLTGLSTAAAYDAYIRAQCDDGSYANWSNVLHFTTLNSLPAAIPYFCDFEDTTESNNWTLVNDTCTNKWYVGTAANNTPNGTMGLYVSQDNGATNTYDNQSTSTVWAYRDFNLTGYGEYTLSFDWRAQGERLSGTNYDYIRVYIGSPVAPVAGATTTLNDPVGATILCPVLNQDSLWSTVRISLDGSQYNGTCRVYFAWRNDYTSGDDPAGAMDNVRIEGINCARPSHLAVSNLTTTTADITWSPASETDSQWEVVYGTEANFDPDTVIATPVSIDTTLTLSGLTASTTYYVYVRTNCGNNEFSTWSNVLSFQTECDEFPIPFTENFDNQQNSQMPTCWTNLGTYYTAPYVSSTYSVSPSKSLYMYSYGSTVFAMVSTPVLDATVDASTLMVSFKMRASSNASTNMLIVGVLDDNTSASSFEPIDTVQVSSSSAWEDKMVFLNNYTGTGHSIGFKWVSSYGYSVYLDDVEIDVAPNCLPVTSVAAMSESATSVSVSWTENGTAPSWDIEYGPQGFTPGAGTTVAATTNPFTISNLTAGTRYDFYVRANCGGGDVSAWAGPAIATPGSYNMPTSGEYTLSLCGGVIYDDGGPSDDYSNNCDVTVVVNPDQTGLFVQLDGTYNIETGTNSRYDYLQIFDGGNTDGTLLFDSHTDNSGTLSVTSTTGPLTIYFKSDGSVQRPGFELQVSCVGGQTPAEPCDAPTNLTVVELADNTATLTWDQTGTPDSWTVSYRQADAATWSTVNTTSKPYSITNLTTDVEYEAFVVANCEDTVSGESNHITFTLTGVNDHVMDNTLLYPNPTTGKFRIENSELRMGNVEVYDVYGKLITTVKVEDNHVELDLSGNASGVYFTRIFTDKGMVTKRIVKK